jgi:hypothetical protein
MFKAAVLPPEYWFAYLVAMVPVLFLFPRFVASREPLTEPVRSLLEGP